MSFLENILLDFFLLFFPVLVVSKGTIFFSKKNLPLLGFREINFLELLKKTIIILSVLLAISFLIVFLSSILQANDLEAVGKVVQETKKESLLLFLYLLTIRVFSEEVFFRGFLVPRVGSTASALLFGLGHAFFGSVIEVIGAIVLGFVLGKFFEKNKNILPNILAHFLYNIIALVVFFDITA